MSHIKRMATKSKFELPVIKRLCKDMGWQFMENQKTYQWYGRWVGDSPMPEGMTLDDLGKCDHAIRIPGCNYEIGLVNMGDRWDLRFDYWYSGGLDKAIGQEGQIFKKLYGFTKGKVVAESHGRAWYEEPMEDGRKRLVVLGSGGPGGFPEKTFEGGVNW